MISRSHILVLHARCFSACVLVILVATVVGLHGRGASQPAALCSASLIVRVAGSPLEQLLGGTKRRPGRKKNGRLEKAGGDSGDDEDSGDEDEEDDDNDGDDD